MLFRQCMFFAFGLLFVLNVASVSGTPSYFDTTCAACHITVSATCNGCHAHGVHPGTAYGSINLAGTTDRSSYGAGDTVSVTVTGGNQAGWVRVILYDQDMEEMARGAGPDGVGGGAGYPVILTAPAPRKSGTYRWNVAWYGSGSDAEGAAFGGRWLPDRGNPEHGQEFVQTNEFSVVAGPAASLRVEPGVVPFGMTPIGASSIKTVSVVNDGTAELVVSAISLCPGTGAEFTWVPSSLMIAPGERQQLQITYSPLRPPRSPSCLRLVTNDPQRGEVIVPMNVAGR